MTKREKFIHGKQRPNTNKNKTKILHRGERNLKYYEQHQSKQNFFKSFCSR